MNKSAKTIIGILLIGIIIFLIGYHLGIFPDKDEEEIVVVDSSSFKFNNSDDEITIELAEDKSLIEKYNLKSDTATLYNASIPLSHNYEDLDNFIFDKIADEEEEIDKTIIGIDEANNTKYYSVLLPSDSQYIILDGQKIEPEKITLKDKDKAVTVKIFAYVCPADKELEFIIVDEEGNQHLIK